MKKDVTTQEQFLALTLKDISSVYNGKRDCCRCGCGGNYVSTSYMKEPRNDINDKLVEKRLKRAQKLVAEGADVDYGGTYIDVQTGVDRTLTFYVDELK